jgi:hypothetical protein
MFGLFTGLSPSTLYVWVVHWVASLYIIYVWVVHWVVSLYIIYVWVVHWVVMILASCILPSLVQFLDCSICRGQVIIPTAHFSDPQLLRQPISPTTHYYDSPFHRQPIIPTAHYSDNNWGSEKWAVGIMT